MNNPFHKGPIPPDCPWIDADDHSLVPVKFVTLMEDGRRSQPCDAFALQTIYLVDGRGYLVMQMAHAGLVLHEAFTPEGARVIAAALNKSADEAEAAMLTASNAQLAATLGKGKPA